MQPWSMTYGKHRRRFLVDPAEELAEHWRFSKDPDHVRLPVKTLKYNRCPAVAPLGVLNAEAQKDCSFRSRRLQSISRYCGKDQAAFAKKIAEAVKILDDERKKTQLALVADDINVDAQLYDGFFSNADKDSMRLVRAALPEELSSIELKGDERLQQLLPLYKARNYPDALTSEERQAWDKYCQRKLQSGDKDSRLAKFAHQLQELATSTGLSEEKRYLLEELQLYAESIVQLDEFDEPAAFAG